MKGSLNIVPMQACQNSEDSGGTIGVEQGALVQNGPRFRDVVSSTGFL
jgi:hypothetical protein